MSLHAGARTPYAVYHHRNDYYCHCHIHHHLTHTYYALLCIISSIYSPQTLRAILFIVFSVLTFCLCLIYLVLGDDGSSTSTSSKWCGRADGIYIHAWFVCLFVDNNNDDDGVAQILTAVNYYNNIVCRQQCLTRYFQNDRSLSSSSSSSSTSLLLSRCARSFSSSLFTTNAPIIWYA